MYKAAQGSYKKYVLYFLSLIVLLTLPCFVNQAFALEQLKTANNANNWSKTNKYTNDRNYTALATTNNTNYIDIYNSTRNQRSDGMFYQSVTTPNADINAYYNITYQTYCNNRTPTEYTFYYYYGNSNAAYNTGTQLVARDRNYDATGNNYNTSTVTSTANGTIRDLARSTTYYFKAYLYVRTSNNGTPRAGVKIYNVSCNFSPSGLTLALGDTNNVIDGIDLRWNKSTSNAVNFKNYKIYRSTTENGTYELVATINNQNTLNYKDTTVTTGGTYWYYITDTGSDNVESPASKKQSIYFPQMVTGLTAQIKVDGWNRIELNWNAIAGYSGQYRTLYSTVSGGPYNTTLWSSSTSVEHGNPPDGSSFYYVTTYEYNGKLVKYSDEVSVFVIFPPEGVTAATTYDAASSKNIVNLSWNAKSIANLQNYKVYRSNTENGTYSLIGTVPAGTTTFVDDNVNPGATYYYKISCSTNKGESTLSNSANAYIYKSPTNLTGIVNGSGHPELTWTAPGNPNPGGYRLFRSNSNSGPWTEVQNWISGTSFTDNGITLSFGDICYYYVTEVNWNYETSPSNIVVLSGIGAPTNLRAVENNGCINLSWTASTLSQSYLSGYNIYRSSTTGGPYTKIGQTVGDVVTYTDNSGSPRETYYYVVTTRTLTDAESVYSNEAQGTFPVIIELTVRCDPSLVPEITLAGQDIISAGVNWTVDGLYPGGVITGYRVSILDAGGNVVSSTNTSGNVTSASVPNVLLQNGQNYSAKVEATYSINGVSATEDFYSVDSFTAIISGTMTVRDGWNGKDISYSVFDNRVEANWDYEAVAPVVRYEAAVGTTPYGTDVVNWTDIGLVNRIAFTTPELASGTTYYTSVRGLTQKKSVAIGGCSNGFIARKDPITTDTDAAMFFNNARVLENLDTSGGRLSPTGTIANGNWKYCMPVTITEPNVTDRVNAPCLVTFTIPAGQRPANVNEFRVTDDCGNIVPRFNLTTPNNSTTTTPYIVFLVNMKQGQTRTYYIYWGSTGVGEMAHGFVDNTNNNSYTAWTPYYSRKDMPAGFDPVAISGTPILRDDDTTSNQNLGLSQFKFFGTNRTTGWYVNCNGYMSSVNTYSGGYQQSCGNMFRRFTGNVGANENFTRNGRSTRATSLEKSICPLWVDLMQGTAWSESGVFSTLANNPTRRIYTWIAYRFNVTDDAYKMQAVLYQTGDIAIRYNLLNPRALVTDGTYDRGVNSSDEHTVGISNGDASHYLYHTPLQIGINQNPTAFYQCMNAFEGNISYGNIIGDGTNYDVAHIESMVFDSRLATPQWQKMVCDATVTGSRRIQLYYRSGNSPLLDGVAWQGPTNITTTGQTNVNITTEGRYIQYKAVFQKTGTTGSMSIEQVKFLFGGISIETVYAERDGQPITEVSQGERDIPVTVSVKNLCSEAVDLNVATMTFTLGGHSATLVAPPLPLRLGVDEVGTLTYMVNIAEDAPTGLCTIDAMATATGDISDDGAQNPLVWTVKSKSTLIIEKVVSDKTEVTKGQTVTMNVYFINTGDADCVFNTASPTFSVGKYTFTLASPAPGFVIPGNGSMIATYAVYISPDSGSGKDTINVVATATNKLSNEKIQANESEQPHAWTIQNPADLILKEVIASETVYRGQKNNPVILRAQNQGEAALEWDAYRSLIRFDPHIGSYENIRKTSGEDKVRLVSNQTSDTIFMVDIKADTATGTDVIDADIFGTEVNRNEPIEYLEGAIIPGQWTIYAEKVNTYGDGSYKIEQNSFNMPTAGNTISVFGKVENLSINTEYVIHWFAPDGTELLTTYPQTSDGDGNLYSSIEINNSSQSGIYKITATNPLNTVTCCQNTFEVVAAASMVATFTLPTKVTVGQTFNASFTYINEGGAGIDSATLGDNVNFGGTGAADLIAPAPGRQFTPQYCEIAGYGQATATYTLTARTAGTLTLTNKASGYDANSHAVLNTPNITSNVCTIQTAPNITITMNALPTTKVFLNQKNLRITATIRNLGQATAIVDAASITALIGSYDQELMGLEQPFELAYNESKTLTFDVGVRPDSNSGNDTLTINAVWYDKNWPESGDKYSHSESRTWNIAEVGIVLSADPNFTPEQNDFSRGQTVNVKAYGVEPNSQYYRIRFYTTQIAQAANVPTGYVTTDQGYSGLLAADEDGYIFHSYVLPNNATIGTWSVTLESCGTSATTSYTTRGAMMGLQYFRVQASPAMSATLTIDDSEEIFVGDTFKVTLTVRNTVANSAAIVNINPYKLIPAAGSTGGAELVSGPEPATHTVRALESKSFEYVFMATADTGATNVAANRFKLTSSDANYIATGDNSNNCDPLVINANKVTSNGLIIYSEAIGVTNPVDFGHMICGDNHLKTDFTIFKVGNFSAKNIRLNTADFNGPIDPETGDMARISKSYFYIEPDCINLLERDTSITAHLDIPYNQKAGQYETTMFVYSDANNNAVYDNGEILAEFKCSVYIDECYLIKMTEDVIDMGDWPKGAKGVETTHMDVGFFNAGNMDLDRIKIDPHPIATATFDFYLSTTNIGAMDVGEARTVQIWADTRKTDPEPVTGTYIATFTIWDDRNGDGIKQGTEPWTTFQARITVGVIQFDLSPAMIEANGVETSQTIYTGVFPNFENLTIKNTGDLELTRIKLNIDEFTDSSGLNSIASSNVIIAPDTLVSRLQPRQTDEFSLALFIPAGTLSATYTATVDVYHDDNRNDILDETEYRKSFVLRVYVAKTYKIQVINHMVYMGGVSSDDNIATQKLMTFLCRNIGNVPLEDLYFIPKPLYPMSGGTPIPISQITFPPTPYFATVEAGELFYPSILLTVPAGQADGVYLTADDCIIFNDLNRDGIKQDNETFDTFRIQVEVGELIIQVNPKNIKVAGNPKETSSVDSVTVQNTGSLDVINIIGSSTILTGPGGATIPSSASVFTPALTSTLPAGQSRPVNWSVNIPASQAAGTYTCNISIWGDSNNNGEWDEGEAVDTVTGELYVKENPGIDIRQDSVDINNEYLTVNTSVSRAIEIENVGNVYIENLKAVKAPLVLGGSSLGEEAITVTFDSLTIDFEGVVIATYTVSMGNEIMATGRYSGVQTVYADLNNNGSWDEGEPKDTFTLSVNIGSRLLDLKPSPLDFGHVEVNSSSTLTVNAKNIGDAPLKKLKCYKATPCDCGCSDAEVLCDDGQTYATILRQESKTYTFNLHVGNTKAGEHIEYWRFYCDDNNNGVWDETASEYCEVLEVKYFVEDVIDLIIVPNTVHLSMQRGETATYSVTVINRGNSDINLADCTFMPFADLVNDTGANLLGSNFGIISYTGDLLAGNAATYTFRVNTVRGMESGIYRGNEKFKVNGDVKADYDLIIEFIDDNREIVPSGTVHQAIASSVFELDPELNRVGGRASYFLSAWVCPGSQVDAGFGKTAYANISVVRYDGETGLPKAVVSVRINNNDFKVETNVTDGGYQVYEDNNIASGTTVHDSLEFYRTLDGSPVYGKSGQAVPAEIEGGTLNEPLPLLFHRIYFGFTIKDYIPEDGKATDTFRIMLTESIDPSNTASATVYFDGIKLEKMILSNQDRPTTYHDGTTLFSPSRSLDVSGNHQYFEW